MTALLELLVAYIGVILVLALASQSLLEAAKTMFPLEGFTRMGSARMLLEEAARASGLPAAAGRDIYAAVARRLSGLGQKGWVGVRLDALSREQLVELVGSLGPAQVPTLQDFPDAKAALDQVARRAGSWYDLAMEPVADRYLRRMRVANIAGAAVVVLFFNVDGLALMQRLRTDAGTRSELVRYAGTLDSLRVAQAGLRERLVQDTAGQPPTSAAADSIQTGLDSIQAQVGRLVQQATGIFDPGAPRRWTAPDWQLGILLSILLVSLGAPFWNDLLGTVFGLKKQMEGKAELARTGGRGSGTVSAPDEGARARDEETGGNGRRSTTAGSGAPSARG